MSDRDEFVVRADREGTPIDVSELRENPFERRAQPRSILRALSGSRGLGAAALAVAVLILGWKLRPAELVATVTGVPAPTGAAQGGIAHLKAADPHSLQLQIIDQLRAAGVQASGYELARVQGIGAQLPQPVPEAASNVLQQHGVPVPAGGALRIEISAP